MENRKRNVHLHVMVTPDELAAIHERMAEAGISNAGAYVRKMALNGYILHIDPVSYTHLDVYKRQKEGSSVRVRHGHTSARPCNVQQRRKDPSGRFTEPE